MRAASAANQDLVRTTESIWDESTDPAWNSAKLPALAQYFSADFRLHETIPGRPPTLEAAKSAHGMAIAAYPNRRIQIKEIVSAGNKVFLRTRVTGTERGGTRFGPETAFGDPKPCAFESWNIYRVESGKVIERWGLDDLRLALIQMRLPLLRGLIETLPFRADSPPSSAEG